MYKRILIASLLGSVVLGAVGCRNSCRRPLFDGNRSAPPLPAVVPPGGYLDSPGPPPGSILIPPPTGGLPRSLPPAGDNGLPPPSIAEQPSGSNFRPAPIPPQRELILPDPLPSSNSKSSKPRSTFDPLLQPPSDTQRRYLGEPARLDENPALTPNTTTTTAEKRSPLANVPNYVLVKPGLANGRKPTADGFTNLRSSGVRTVVYLHKPNAELAQMQEMVQAKGMTFLPIAVAPETLKTNFATFAETIGRRDLGPFFIFDEDGLRTGNLWYLYFRKIDSLGDDAAQVRAAPLGLRDATGDERLKFTIAVQELLSKR